MRQGKIFISYRRGTDGNAARLLHDQLADKFGPDQIFFDIDSIPPGIDFVEYLDGQVGQCQAFVAIIGPSWINAIERLQSQQDFVRIEIESALERQGIPVIPLLVDGAQMPDADLLPPTMRSLVRRNGIQVHQRHFDLIVDGELVPALESVLQAATPTPDPAPEDTNSALATSSKEPSGGVPGFVWALGGGAVAVIAVVAVMAGGGGGTTVPEDPKDPKEPIAEKPEEILIAIDDSSDVKDGGIVSSGGTTDSEGPVQIAAQSKDVDALITKLTRTHSDEAIKSLAALGPKIIPGVIETIRQPVGRIPRRARLDLVDAMTRMLNADPRHRSAASKMMTDEDLNSFLKGSTARANDVRTYSFQVLSALQDPRTLELGLAHWKKLPTNPELPHLQMAKLMLDLAPGLSADQAKLAQKTWPDFAVRSDKVGGVLKKALASLPQ